METSDCPTQCCQGSKYPYFAPRSLNRTCWSFSSHWSCLSANQLLVLLYHSTMSRFIIILYFGSNTNIYFLYTLFNHTTKVKCGCHTTCLSTMMPLKSILQNGYPNSTESNHSRVSKPIATYKEDCVQLLWILKIYTFGKLFMPTLLGWSFAFVISDNLTKAELNRKIMMINSCHSNEAQYDSPDKVFLFFFCVILNKKGS